LFAVPRSKLASALSLILSTIAQCGTNRARVLASPSRAAIFDNLHMMHDIISDILVSDSVPRARKRDVIYAQLREFADSVNRVMTWED